MEFAIRDIQTMAYIRSEAEYNRIRMKGFWETIRSLITGCRAELLSFDQLGLVPPLGQTISLGIQDISIDKIAGSMGRGRDFSRQFAPLTNHQSGKERWRTIYALAVTAKGFPPVELYKIGCVYFVEDGHHRISVAKHLAWKTIQARVIELSQSTAADPRWHNSLVACDKDGHCLALPLKNDCKTNTRRLG